jgi:hypothetical protein
MVKNLLILALTFSTFSQTVLKPNQAYTPKDTMVVFTVAHFNKLDSILADTVRYQKQIGLLNQKGRVSDSLEGVCKGQLQNCNTQVQLFQSEKVLYTSRDSLLTQKALVYKGLVDDLQKQVNNDIKKVGFFNDVFWFGAGAVVGVASVYISSLALHNIK